MKVDRVAPNFKDLTGKRFGRLTVVCRVKIENKWKWECSCDCGNTVYVISSKLNNGQSSCGCIGREKCAERCRVVKPGTKGYGEAARNTVLHFYKSGAKDRNITFSLPNDLFFDLIQQPCVYCGRSSVRSAEFNVKGNPFYGTFSYTGLDRVDNNRGYEIDNVEPCCWDCNNAKKTMGKDAFISWISLVHTHLESKGVWK